MKSFVTIVVIANLFFCLCSCDEGKSGPFTFTNNTGTEVHVLIDQDGVLEKAFTAGEKYQGKDYFTPKITFVKGFVPETDKSIVDNKYTASSTTIFDYSFVKVDSTAINILVNLPEALPPELTGCYLAEAQGKLGEYSDTEINLTSGMSSPVSEKLYTNSPNFRIYRDKTVDGKQEKEDITKLFTIAVGKSEIPPMASETSPTVQWNLEITYPKVEVVQN